MPDESAKVTGTEASIRAFGADHVVRLTGLTHAQLRYWDKTGFFSPEFESRPRVPFGRVYSFQNLVGLRTLSVLRKSYQIPLQQLRKVAQELSRFRNAPWSELSLYVLGKEVYFREPETGQIRSALGRQYALITLRSIIDELAGDVNKLRDRGKDQLGRIERNRNVVHNAWVVSGTRVPVGAIKRFHDAGYSTAKIIREYPTLTEQDVLAALKHEAKRAKRA